MKPPRKSREQLEAEVAALRSDLEVSRSECKRADDRAGRLRADLDEVKERLAAAETENNRMRGYIDRVMEDDHEREQLVTIGEPGGDQQLVPKRKHREQPHICGPIARNEGDINFHSSYRDACIGREPKKRRHWVTY